MAELTIGHTDEVRALVASGDIKPGAKELDVPVASMTDRELAEETVIHLRNLRDGLTQLTDGLATSPLMKMVSGGGGPFASLFGGR